MAWTAYPFSCTGFTVALIWPYPFVLLKSKQIVVVPDADAEVEGAPGSPLDVRCLDANKDYIIVTWKQPAVDGGNSILGYFVDRSVSQAKTLRVV